MVGSLFQSGNANNSQLNSNPGEKPMKTFAPMTKLGLLLCFILISATAALAQSQATTGNIEGRVLDPKGAAVPGATVTATNQQTGLEKTTTSSDQGDFSIILLPPGSYTVRANATGFAQNEIQGVVVTVG